MLKKKYLLFFSLFLLGFFLFISCLSKPPLTEGILKGQVMVPEGSIKAKDLTGQALPDATVNIIDLATGDIIATTTTDANGYYQVFVPAGGPYLLEAIKDGVKVQQFTSQVEVGIEYDLGTADCSTTAVALIAQAMMDAEDYPDDPADINLADIEANPDFDDVLSFVCGVLGAGGDPAVSTVVQQAVEDFLYPQAAVINIAAIPGVTAPATGATPVTTITATAQYTGIVTWAPAHNPFLGSQAYTATITLTPKAGFTLTGVAANFFTVAGATATNPINSGVVSAVFPATAAIPITAIAAITGTPQVGVELTAGALTPVAATASYQWQISATVGGTYTNITGATTNKYTPVAGDAAKFIKVVATGTGNYSGTVTSDPTTTVAPATLESIAITTPATKLSYSIGDALDIAGLVVTGTYSDTTTKVETITTGNVTGFNSSAPVVDQVLTITVGGKTTTYTVTIVATPITAIAAISGTPQVGVELTAGALTPEAATASYQWQISATVGGTYTNITGATTNKYTPVAGDVTKFIKVVATGTGNYSGSVPSAATAVVLPLAIGQSYCGGKVAYILVSGDPGYSVSVQHGLIAAAADQNSGVAIVWSNIIVNLAGTNIAIGTGQANTTAIVGQIGCTGGAAWLCNDLTEGGYSDWFLPSKDELNKLYLNRVAIGGFATSNCSYWCSSEYNATNALYYNFYNGIPDYASKGIALLVRAVRAF